MRNLREKLAKPRESKTITEFFQYPKAIVDELSLTNTLVIEDDFVIYALNGISSDFKEIFVVVRARETTISFKDLFDKMNDYESFLTNQENPMIILSHQLILLASITFLLPFHEQVTNLIALIPQELLSFILDSRKR